MNISKYGEKNLAHPRGLFLTFGLSFIIGDIIAISDNGLYEIGIFLILFLCISLKVRWRIFGFVSIIAFFGGYILGGGSYTHQVDTFQHMEALGVFSGEKYHYTGYVENILYHKERSNVYRLHIDTIANSSTGSISVPERKFTIFVEVPSNLKIHTDDTISFTGKVSMNIHFPLKGYDRYSFYQGGFGTIFLPVFTREKASQESIVEKIRIFWKERFIAGFPEDVSGVLLGMTVGIIDTLDAGVKNSFIQSGISHILVVSGSNIAFLILFLTFFLKYTPLKRVARMSIIIFFILFYGTLVGWEVSVIRATLMGILGYSIVEYGGKISSISSLVLSGVVLTLLSPLSPVYDAGFGLSFGATAGILIFHERIKNIWEKLGWNKYLLPIISVSLGASLGSLPIMIYHFGVLPIGSILINILIAGILGWILFSAVIFIPLDLISHSISYLFGYCIYIPTKYIVILSEFFRLGYSIIIPENMRTPLTLILLGGYTVLLLEKDVLFREEKTRFKKDH